VLFTLTNIEDLQDIGSNFDGRPDGPEILVIGASKLVDDPSGDGDGERGSWAE